MRRHQLGEPLCIECIPAKYTRRGVEEGTYWFVQELKELYQFAKGSVFHLIEQDINQELYDLPEFLSALNSACLNESATLFRHKYYQNGAHAGYILYMTDPAQIFRGIQQMREIKGNGDFRNQFMCTSNGKKDGIQIGLLTANRKMMRIILDNAGGAGGC